MTFSDVALSWVGTPYKHAQKVKHQGCDCLGFVRGVTEEFTGKPTEEPIPHSPNWFAINSEDTLKDYLGRNYNKRESLGEGAIVLFTMMGVDKHVGIDLGNGFLLHSVNPHGVIRNLFTDRWKSRIVGVFEVKNG